MKLTFRKNTTERKRDIKTQTDGRVERNTNLHLLPDVRVSVLTLNVLQQLLHQRRASLSVHQGRRQLRAADLR